ncbi:hypothetical protein OF001_U390008 [Pseudomonas sp. OF001]|nr:hypothetical protein OF001_U390008 [Pseudomonas sp. OF001]
MKEIFTGFLLAKILADLLILNGMPHCFTRLWLPLHFVITSAKNGSVSDAKDYSKIVLQDCTP